MDTSRIPSPLQLLEMRGIARSQWEYSERGDRTLVSVGTNRGPITDETINTLRQMSAIPPERVRAVIDGLNDAICFWWSDTMLSLALASPLPANYTIPKPPFDHTWMAFHGSDDAAFGSVLWSGPYVFVLAPIKAMQERFGWYDPNEFAARLLIFLDSPYVTTTRQRVQNKNAVRRLRKLNLNADDVRYVTLRTPIATDGVNRGEHPAWSHRWLVRGHYRNQWYALSQAHRTIWIGSYVKGPSDKPIREPIYKVTR